MVQIISTLKYFQIWVILIGNLGKSPNKTIFHEKGLDLKGLKILHLILGFLSSRTKLEKVLESVLLST